METAQATLEQSTTDIEKIMLDLPTINTPKENKMYLGGVIDTWAQVEFITPEIRESLYADYVAWNKNLLL